MDPFWIALLLSFLWHPAASEEERCLTALQAKVSPKRLYHGGEVVDLTLEVSHRLSHQLITHVIKMVLEEFYGYHRVRIVEQEDHFLPVNVLKRLSGVLRCTSSCVAVAKVNGSHPIPDTMANLELWLPPGSSMENWEFYDFYDSDSIAFLGNLGPGGRLGWWYPSHVDTLGMKAHWEMFKVANVSQIFRLSGEEYHMMKKHMIDPLTGKYYCSNDDCVEGMKTPPKCKGQRIRHRATEINGVCGFLLASYPEVEASIMAEIEEMELFLEVAYLGPHLVQFAEHLLKRNVPFLFLHYWPSEILLSGNFRMVLLPPCLEHSSLNPSWKCNYALRHFVKVAWKPLLSKAPDAFEVMSDLYFHQKDYEDLLASYHEGERIRDVACRWLRGKGDYLWKHRRKTSLYIGGIFPLHGSVYNAVGVVPAAMMARDAVNKDDSILEDYVLEVQLMDGQCKPDMVMMSFIQYIIQAEFKQFLGILGPACSNTIEPIAGVSKHFKTVVISYSAEGAVLTDREKYPYFFRTIGENRQFKAVYLQLLQQLGWKRVASLTEDGEKYAEYLSQLQDLLEANKISFIANRKFPRVRETQNMSQYLDEFQAERARIIIGDFYDSAARAVMCEAYKKGMTAKNGYVWFLPRWFSRDWFHASHYNQILSIEERVPCNTSEMMEAINGHFSLAYAYFAEEDALMQESITVGEWRKRYEAECANSPKIKGGGVSLPENIHPSDYAGFAYDAVWTFALAADKLLKENHSHVADFHSISAVQRLVEIINETDFLGVSGHVQFRGPSRRPIINVLQWRNNASVVVGTFFPNEEDGEGRYDAKVRATKEHMRALGLLASSNMLALDEWEIPKENVVINRKIGEGAFGTVYGGEASIDDRGWVRDLKTYLLSRRHLVHEKDSDEVSPRRLTCMALDIARGLAFLAQLKYVHRENLLRSCWDLTPTKRPHASEIVDLLSNNPCLITPCPDIPSAPLQLQEMTLVRKPSSGRRKRSGDLGPSEGSLSPGTSSVAIPLTFPTALSLESHRRTFINGLYLTTGKFEDKAIATDSPEDDYIN
ncbi:unnamed protein product [Darwinula stevensoni]|uniref:Gamma-aminobutyric acid type B receptor subunit 2 n=1 Tax=Darwinula stevensoni TaxID=69355 RepID=A0A7R8WYJ1_9CRUS|nr:unnamed protein product [Darwinula stevensoni]CAG0879002.1 unnamed protein product [Darwinula stevensoni]